MAKISYVFLIIFTFHLTSANVSAAPARYPVPIEKIDRDQANYLTPENTLSALASCEAAQDLAWCDEALTSDSLQELLQLYAEANIDRSQVPNLASNVKESFITNKIDFKGAVLLLIEDHDNDGKISQMPMAFIQENNLWKLTYQFAADDDYLQYLYTVPPLFYGKGQSPAGANKFLGYEQPTQVKTELSPGETSYTLKIFYGKTVIPNTFKAEVNRQDIKSLFSPQPFTDQEVEIPLQKGRNVLVLSIDGTKSKGKKGSDTDRLTFIVP